MRTIISATRLTSTSAATWPPRCSSRSLSARNRCTVPRVRPPSPVMDGTTDSGSAIISPPIRGLWRMARIELTKPTATRSATVRASRMSMMNWSK